MQPWMQYEITKGKSFLLWIIFSHRVFNISQTLLKIAHKSRKIFHETRIALIQKSAVYTVHILVYAPLLPNKNTKRKHYYCNFFIQFIFCLPGSHILVLWFSPPPHRHLENRNSWICNKTISKTTLLNYDF